MRGEYLRLRGPQHSQIILGKLNERKILGVCNISNSGKVLNLLESP
jgi:hypothetical protein